jgi:TM2 domain-containing membrane protein YozV
MKKRLILILLSILFFVIYFKILQFLYNAFVPFNTLTDIISIFIIIVVIIPASVISATKITRMLKTI